MSCASCGSEVPSGARFCPSCGSSLIGGTEERRVVTVLFADIVGFTALAEQLDPEHVKGLVDRCFVQLTSDITAFGGVVDKIVGDEIVALFGAPVAHEDDAERAVRAALRMQSSLKDMGAQTQTPFEMRIGINTGEVLVGSSASGNDYTAMGDVMNTASRLQTMAEPGQIVVGGSTQALTRTAIAYRPLGMVEAKGRAETVEAWIARTAVRPPGARVRRTSEFVGRERELEVLLAQARLAIELEQAQVALLGADAGMGKTRLAEEVASRLRADDGAAVYRGRCVPYGEANVWWPVAEVLRQMFELDVDATDRDAQVLIRAGLSDTLAGRGLDLERASVAALHALGYATSLRNGNRDRNRAEVTMMLASLLEVRMEQRPIVLLLSDMHWAAEAVWSLIHNLLAQLSRSRLMVILTTRQAVERRLEPGRFGTLRMELGPLPEDAARSLVAELDGDLSDDDVEELVARSGGNPFFLEELSEMVGRDAARRVSWRGLDAHERMAQIPDTLRGLLAARLDELDPVSRRVLEAASVIGRSGLRSDLNLLIDRLYPGTDVDAGIEALTAAELVAVEGSRFIFVSDLIREVAYSTITKASRARTHGEIAQYLEAEYGPPYRNSVVVAVARHYRVAATHVIELGDALPRGAGGFISGELAGMPPVDHTVERAAYWQAEAGWRAAQAGVWSEAEDWFSGALELAAPADRPMLLYGRARSRAEQRNVSGTRSDLDQLDSIVTNDPVMLAKALVVRGDIEGKAGELDRSVQLLTEAINQLHGLGQSVEESVALRLLGLTDMYRNDNESARSSLELARQVAESGGHEKQHGWALQALAWLAFREGRLDEADRYVRAATDIFADLDDRAGELWTLGAQAWVAFHRGELKRAAELLDEVAPEARRGGDPWAEAVVLILQASRALWGGRASDAIERAREAQTVAERADDFSLGVQARAVEGRALLSLGRVAEGLGVLEQVAVLADRAAVEETRRIAVVANVAAASRFGDAERALRWAQRYPWSEAEGDVVGRRDYAASLALAHLALGEFDEAEANVAPLLEGAHRSSFAAAVGALISAAVGDHVEAERRWSWVLNRESTYMDRVWAQIARAVVAVSQDDPAMAASAIQEARGLVETTDDRPTLLLLALFSGRVDQLDTARMEDEIRATGIDPVGWQRLINVLLGV